MPDHKIVCWGDYAIPVTAGRNWIAWDKCGDVYAYYEKPSPSMTQWVEGHGCELFSSLCPPPEPGPWTDQLYWIGD